MVLLRLEAASMAHVFWNARLAAFCHHSGYTTCGTLHYTATVERSPIAID